MRACILAGAIGVASALSGCLGRDGGSLRRVNAARAVGFPSEQHGYGLSLQSESLIDPDYSPDPFAAKHWGVAATAPARGLVETVDRSVAYPRAEFRSSPRRFTVDGIEATLVTGDLAGSGFAGTGHAIVYWTIGETFHQASVHFDDKARVAEMIARGLMAQMADCDPSVPSGRRICDWVFPGGGLGLGK